MADINTLGIERREALGDALHHAMHPNHEWVACSTPEAIYDKVMPRFLSAIRDAGFDITTRDLDIEHMSDTHPVYPGGPDCQPNCPGPWSSYHDGYADGYERGVRVPTEAGDGLRAAYLAGVRRGASDGMEGYPEVADDYLAASPAPTLPSIECLCGDVFTRTVDMAEHLWLAHGHEVPPAPTLDREG